MTNEQAGALAGASLRGSVSLQHARVVFDAVVQTFGSICGVQLRVLDKSPDSFGQGIAAVVSMSGDVAWMTFVGLPGGTACEAAARMAGCPVPGDSSDMDDAVARLGNIVSEQVRSALAEVDVTTDLLLPTVCRIDDFGDFVRRAGTADFRCFNSEMGDVWAGVIAGL